MTLSSKLNRLAESVEAATGPEYQPLRMLGSCRDGAERDGGERFHAVGNSWKALCGKRPGRRSAGWAAHPDQVGERVTCPGCLKRLDREAASKARADGGGDE